MTRKIFIILIAGIFAVAMMGAAEDSDKYGYENGKLKKGYKTIKKTGSEEGLVTFFHRKHKKHAMNDEKCKTCHHVGKWKQSCGEAGCHDDPEKDSGGERIHAGCLDRCHVKSEGKAPADCSECHR